MTPREIDTVREVAVVAHEPRRDGYVSDYKCNVAPARGVPVVTPGVARAEMVRLLPRPKLGVAPVDGVTLVHIDTIFWVDTSAGLDLGSATLLGQRVSLRAHLQKVEWVFGDGAVGESDGPGRAYTAADSCRTVRCPDYFTHAFDTVGTDRVGARLIWAGQFRVGDGGWQDIAQMVPLESPAVTVQVRAARGVLTSNP